MLDVFHGPLGGCKASLQALLDQRARKQINCLRACFVGRRRRHARRNEHAAGEDGLFGQVRLPVGTRRRVGIHDCDVNSAGRIWAVRARDHLHGRLERNCGSNGEGAPRGRGLIPRCCSNPRPQDVGGTVCLFDGDVCKVRHTNFLTVLRQQLTTRPRISSMPGPGEPLRLLPFEGTTPKVAGWTTWALARVLLICAAPCDYWTI